MTGITAEVVGGDSRRKLELPLDEIIEEERVKAAAEGQLKIGKY